MKFGQDYEAALARGEYPPDWINSAISYKKLKKCIKRVQGELLSLGLDKDTLDSLWGHVGSAATDADGKKAEKLVEYTIQGSEKISFTPTLTIVIDPRDGSPMDARLSPDTRRILRRIARSSRASIEAPHPRDDSSDRERSDADDPDPKDEQQVLKTVEIPLTADSEFFQTLRKELDRLDNLQNTERDQLQEEIAQLGNDLRTLRQSKKKQAKREIEIWRKIFEQYMDAEVFLSSHEADAGSRNASHAEKQLKFFTQSLDEQKPQIVKLGQDANAALSRFVRINVTLLRLMRFQEINRTALTKIMKKFGKRTALHPHSSISTSLTKSPFIAQDLAKATYFTISEEILTILPQLNDYLCPICFSISYKPVRLDCNHVFCIRCMIVMQRQGKEQCPLCREDVVMTATSKNVDRDLVKLMKANFKQEVKEKQRYNEIQAGIDQWGVAYTPSQKCIVM